MAGDPCESDLAILAGRFEGLDGSLGPKNLFEIFGVLTS